MVSLENFIKNIMATAKKKVAKKATKVEPTATTPEVTLEVTTTERDEAFYKAHKGAREDVIYG